MSGPPREDDGRGAVRSPSRERRTAKTKRGVRANRGFWVIWVGLLINSAGTMVQPFLLLYLTGPMGLAVGQAGLIAALLGAGSLASQLIGGRLADSIGRKRTMVTGTLASACAVTALGFGRGPVALAVLAALVGLVSEIYRPAAMAMVSDLVEEDERPTAYSLLFWAVNLGFAGAGLAAGYLAEANHQLLFIVDGATFLLFACLMAFGLGPTPPRRSTPSTRPNEQPTHRRRVPGGELANALRRFDVLLALGVVLLFSTVYKQAFVGLPLALELSGTEPRVYGQMLAINGGVIAVVQPLVSRYLLRSDTFIVVAISQMILGIGFAATAFASSVTAYASTVVVWTLGEVGTGGFKGTIASLLAPDHARGRYQSLFGVAQAGAGVLAPLIGGAVVGAWGATTLWMLCLVAAASSALGTRQLGLRVARSAGQE